MALPVPRGLRVLLAACVALAALSLLLPWDLSIDPWGWVLWGREIVQQPLPFDTVGYPSWKPLPVVFTSVFALFGGAAPSLWLVTARAGSLLAVVLAYRLGARLGGRVAGSLAAVGTVLLAGWFRYFASGTSEPLLVALVLWAIERHVEGRRGQALGLAFAAALLRPEVWPFLVPCAILYARGGRRRAAMAGALLLLVPVLWFVPEWIGAGDPLHGAALARASAEARATQRLASPPSGRPFGAWDWSSSRLPWRRWSPWPTPSATEERCRWPWRRGPPGGSPSWG